MISYISHNLSYPRREHEEEEEEGSIKAIMKWFNPALSTYQMLLLLLKPFTDSREETNPQEPEEVHKEGY